MPFMLDSVSDIILVLNEHRQIVYANRMLQETFDLEDTRIQGLRPGEALDCVHAYEPPGGCGTTVYCRTCGLAKALLPSLRGQDKVEECSIIRQDGSALEFRVRARPLILDNHRYSVFSMQDISDEKRRRALERIFYHDILNSAGLLAGYASLLDDERAMDADVLRGSLREIANRLIEEIRAQRDLAEAEAYELNTQSSTLNSVDLLTTLKSVYEGHMIAEGRRIVIAADAQSIDFSTDETLLRRVVGNMLKNALESSHNGATVTLSCALVDGYVELSVHNPGAIPAQEQSQIFRRSFSTKGTNRGLGTYSMKLLTERYLQGHVGFTSTPEHGTRFFAQVPV